MGLLRRNRLGVSDRSAAGLADRNAKSRVEKERAMHVLQSAGWHPFEVVRVAPDAYLWKDWAGKGWTSLHYVIEGTDLLSDPIRGFYVWD